MMYHDSDQFLLREKIEELRETIHDLEQKIYRLQNHIMSADKQNEELALKLKTFEHTQL